MTYKLLLTNLGKQKIAAAASAGASPLRITQFAIGQGVDVDFSKRLDEQVLVSKRYQADVHSVGQAATGIPGQYEIICIVPQDVGGWTIREMGLIDADGDMIWVGQLPNVQKPKAGDTSAVDYRIKAVVSIDNPDVNLVIDTHVIGATQSWVALQFQLLIPFGYKYWAHDAEDNPKPRFDALLGIPTFWRRLEGVHLVGIRDGDANIGAPNIRLGKEGDVTADSQTPDHYQIYPGYLWERYDPDATLIYSGEGNYDGTYQYK